MSTSTYLMYAKIHFHLNICKWLFYWVSFQNVFHNPNKYCTTAKIKGKALHLISHPVGKSLRQLLLIALNWRRYHICKHSTSYHVIWSDSGFLLRHRVFHFIAFSTNAFNETNRDEPYQPISVQVSALNLKMKFNNPVGCPVPVHWMGIFVKKRQT